MKKKKIIDFKYIETEDYWMELTIDQYYLYETLVWMINNRATIRRSALKWEFSKSTLHKKIHKDCRELFPNLYKQVLHQMKWNIHHQKHPKRRK